MRKKESERDGWQNKMFSALSNEEKEQMLSLTEKLYKAWSQHAQKHGQHHHHS